MQLSLLFFHCDPEVAWPDDLGVSDRADDVARRQTSWQARHRYVGRTAAAQTERKKCHLGKQVGIQAGEMRRIVSQSRKYKEGKEERQGVKGRSDTGKQSNEA